MRLYTDKHLQLMAFDKIHTSLCGFGNVHTGGQIIVVITRSGEKTKTILIDLCNSINEVIMKITMFVIKLAPYGVFAIVSNMPPSPKSMSIWETPLILVFMIPPLYSLQSVFKAVPPEMIAFSPGNIPPWPP